MQIYKQKETKEQTEITNVLFEDKMERNVVLKLSPVFKQMTVLRKAWYLMEQRSGNLRIRPHPAKLQTCEKSWRNPWAAMKNINNWRLI